MKSRHPLVQIALMIALASVLALVSNAMASRQRKLVLPGAYPNATRVPQRTSSVATASTSPVAIPTATAAPVATTTTMSPAPGAPPMVIPTATVERPAGVPAATATIAPKAVPAATTTQPAPAVATTTTAPPAPPAPKPNVDRFVPHPDKPYVEISGDDVAALYAAGALFLDARRTSIYEQGHIAGSRSYSVWESDVDDKVNALYEERSDPAEQNKPIVIYCSGGDCEDSHMLAQKLWGVQFNNVYVYKDGYPDWLKRNGATRIGGKP